MICIEPILFFKRIVYLNDLITTHKNYKMKKLFLTLVIALNSLIVFTQTPQYVNGYYRSNGNYVQGYYRTKANNTIRDNYSTKGNINPYTGKRGTKTYYNTNNYKSQNSYTYRRRR